MRTIENEIDWFDTQVLVFVVAEFHVASAIILLEASNAPHFAIILRGSLEVHDLDSRSCDQKRMFFQHVVVVDVILCKVLDASQLSNNAILSLFFWLSAEKWLTVPG